MVGIFERDIRFLVHFQGYAKKTSIISSAGLPKIKPIYFVQLMIMTYPEEIVQEKEIDSSN